MRRGYAAIALMTLLGCEEPTDTSAAASASAAPPPAKTAAAPTAAPSATASATAPKPSHPCPEGSKGDGTFKSPCKASGATRLMDVTWTGKITDKGPSFQVANKTDLEIMYGHLFVYFYDAAGKQLAVAGAGDAEGEGDKRMKQGCGGNIFAGPVKPGEKFVLWFSCVKKEHVPEGAAKIEAEMQTVGFTGKDSDTADTFWQNPDLAVDERPLGGVK